MSNFGNFGLPNQQLPVGAAGEEERAVSVRVADIWYRFFTRLSQLTAERPIAAVTVNPAPGSTVYEATTIGHLCINGGTVTAVNLRRGDASIFANTTVSFVPMAAGDLCIVYYTVAPTLNFVPSARA